MPSCVIKGCKNNTCFQKKGSRTSGITFHKFPTDTRWKEGWIRAVRDNRSDVEWIPSKFSVVCSVHFQEIDIYNTKGGYRRIKKNATPKKILLNSEWCQEMEASGSSINTKSSTLGLKTEDCNVDEEVDVAGNFGDTSRITSKLTEDVSKPSTISNDKISDTWDSELESLFDTPEEHNLRQQARKYKLLSKVHVRKIKTLNQKVKRLKKRNALLIAILKDIRAKIGKKTIANP